jgi:hypothetical protein
LQLAAEAGGTIGLLIRPVGVRGHPSWSESQFLVEALPGEKLRRLRIEVVRSRNGNLGASTIVELDDETGAYQASRAMPVASELAAATSAAGPAGA